MTVVTTNCCIPGRGTMKFLRSEDGKSTIFRSTGTYLQNYRTSYPEENTVLISSGNYRLSHTAATPQRVGGQKNWLRQYKPADRMWRLN